MTTIQHPLDMENPYALHLQAANSALDTHFKIKFEGDGPGFPELHERMAEMMRDMMHLCDYYDADLGHVMTLAAEKYKKETGQDFGPNTLDAI